MARRPPSGSPASPSCTSKMLTLRMKALTSARLKTSKGETPTRAASSFTVRQLHVCLSMVRRPSQTSPPVQPITKAAQIADLSFVDIFRPWQGQRDLLTYPTIILAKMR